MKRIDLIKAKICREIIKCEPEKLNAFLRGREEEDSLYKIALNSIFEFDQTFFKDKDDMEIKEDYKSGEYDKMYIRWLEEDI